MLSLDEAIKHCEEVAEKFDTELNLINCGISNESCDDCLQYAKDHRQLAEWLRELKAYREAEEAINRKMKSGQWSDAVVFGMGKALLIMRKHIREVNADEEINN